MGKIKHHVKQLHQSCYVTYSLWLTVIQQYMQQCAKHKPLMVLQTDSENWAG